jgi:hypothetical protein
VTSKIRVSEEHIASIFRVTKQDILGARNKDSCHSEDRHDFPPKRRFLLEPHGVKSQKKTNRRENIPEESGLRSYIVFLYGEATQRPEEWRLLGCYVVWLL